MWGLGPDDGSAHRCARLRGGDAALQEALGAVVGERVTSETNGVADGPLAFPLVKLGLAAAVQRRPGEIDYRLERQRVLAAYRSGAQSQLAVCDAQVELLRNAEHCGTSTDEPCPICADGSLKHVTYVFGPRLPASGRCITSPAELARLAKRKSPYSAYVVEVCVECRWNHLVRSYLLNPLV